VWITLLLVGVLVVFLAVMAYGVASRQRVSLKPGDAAPDFMLQPFDGSSSVSLAALSGKIVVVNFWASWCVPCQQEAGWLQQAWEQYAPGGQVVFIGVDYMDTNPAAAAFIKQYGMTYPTGPDQQSQISHDYNVLAVPESYIVGRDGKLAYVQIGAFASYEQIKDVIGSLLTQ
jgi:cytochrome c biogenesis protein CcmG/thiol:disulfide interchange protein DsbE